MKSFKILFAFALALSFVAQVARADNFDEINNENQEGKIIAALRYHKSDAISSMQSALKEMVKIQKQVGEGDESNGRLRALGQMIDITSATIKDAKKLDAELDENYTKLDKAVAGVTQMRDEARKLAK
jgi:hypothetical protein